MNPATCAVVICDMWDAHHCVSAARRVAEMAPRMNEVVEALREQGALIIHAPAGCVDFYAGTPARLRALQAPHADAPVPIDWNDRDPAREPPLPARLGDPGPCSCDTPEPCGDAAPPYPWTRQIASIRVAPEDAVSDDGQEVFNLLEQRGIEDVVVMGVHTNLCVLGRPYGIRQLVYFGKRPVLCRDLTDAFHRDPRGHAWGTEQTVVHIERHWCATVTSDQLVGGTPFRFQPVLGLERGAVRLAPHTARWAALYAEEEARLRAALEGVLVDVQHFGSTSIPGIHAKPILDILAGVRNRDDVFARRPQLQALGYGYVPGAGVPGHHVFGKGEPRTHLLHVVEHGSRDWTENLWFRDRLRADPALAAEYDALKLRLAQAHPGERARYTEAKSDFVQRIRRQAPG